MGIAQNNFTAKVAAMTHHPHAAAVDRIGREPIMQHFGISRQAIQYWRKKGVPHMHRKTLSMLAAIGGIPVPELNDNA